MRFDDLRLIEPLLAAIRAVGYDRPTPIQIEAIPHVLAGRDVLACAQTGTGKTAAFALPVMQGLIQRPRPKKRSNRNIRCLVLCPTRELASQIHESFQTYGRHTYLKHAVIFGGVNQNPQVRAIRAGVDTVVATPGRLLDLMNQGVIEFDTLEVLVLDEADRMFDMGFLPDLRRILKKLPQDRQNLLFSATMPAGIRKLADDMLRQPARVQVSRVSAPAEAVSHWVHHVDKAGKPALLAKLLEQTHTRTLVFTRTKHGADKVVRHLSREGIEAAAIHGNKSQGARTRALDGFRTGKTQILVATDIAARGIDVEEISHVINYDLTNEPETYIHRIGRTGRAGASGTAISFCTPEDIGHLRAIERLLSSPLRAASARPAPDTPSIRPGPADQTQTRTRKPQTRNAGSAATRRHRRRRPSGRSHSKPTARNRTGA